MKSFLRCGRTYRDPRMSRARHVTTCLTNTAGHIRQAQRASTDPYCSAPFTVDLVVLLLPIPSQKRRRLATLSFFGRSGQASLPPRASPNFILREKRQTKTPTPTPSPLLALISRALRSNRTRSPSFTISFSTCLFRSTIPPAKPFPQTTSPDLRSTLQHSVGTMLAETSVDNLGLRESERLRRMLTSDQCSRLAARWVLVR